MMFYKTLVADLWRANHVYRNCVCYREIMANLTTVVNLDRCLVNALCSLFPKLGKPNGKPHGDVCCCGDTPEN